jgi:hypothetical protein
VRNIHRFENFRIRTAELLNEASFCPLSYIEDEHSRFYRNISVFYQITLYQISESGFLVHHDKNFKSHLRIFCVQALPRDLQSFETFAIKKLQSSSLKIDIAESCEILADIYQAILCHVPGKIIKIITV